MINKEIENVVAVLNSLKEDNTVPKNVRMKIEGAIKILNDDTEMKIKVSKVLSELEEIADDVNLQSYTRTQIWDAISVLEKVK
ncbi:hypothetical protein CMO93_04380 [Candidatus Woesearchaeota archaeon]|nr:hypothetical protein [Candidatus Woesearchaeota archaeon]|tara:strand:- start:3458 stop:3706 length:249 start_codon:yes stop_codon:yes gene_type:complete